ncbi:DUF7289 family protein [Natranaeroarchaeum sulfidigenes]|uniref:Putative pilin/flagellin n=1 Tax=Natranaeroarchaeum sulfidigenes TaxID=2784880 RepID=A0A897MRU9_9EURY|nr:hypothetical protein [Natranaeroarchaeum sulfidigenes]QSG03237.1 putative pilin/flagellin [Natranaeroarchaeum sulfidigenes]
MIGPEHHDETPSARDRAVSDLLAFVLVFGIIITSVGVVYIFGLGALGDTQAAQQDRNAERAFSSMGASFNDLQTNRGQERLAELNPRGARMSIDESSPTISVDGISELNDQDMGAMHYDNDNTRISYELGAVFRSDDENSVMIREPEFVCRELDSDETRAIVSFVDASIEGDGPTAVGSESTMQIGAIQDRQDLHYQESGDEAESITVEITGSDHAEAWERYFEENGWDPVDVESGDTVTATCEDPDNAVVRSTDIELSLERGES